MDHAVGRAEMTHDIDWLRAVFGGACLGGLFWAVIVRLTVFSANSASSVPLKWLAIAVVCFGLITAGCAVARWGRTRALRTAGAAVVIAPLTGASILLIFGGPGVLLT
jgi:hypothetical protein